MKRSPETVERIRRGVTRAHELRRRAERIVPAELRRYAQSGKLDPSLREIAADATEELDSIVQALGGPDEVSPQRLALLQDFCRASILARGFLGNFLENPSDREAPGRMLTALRARQSILAMLGLDRLERELTLSQALHNAAEDGE